MYSNIPIEKNIPVMKAPNVIKIVCFGMMKFFRLETD